MNCKPGDLAIIVGWTKGCEWSAGKVVKVVKWFDHYGDDAWLLETDLVAPNGHQCNAALDRYLRPVSGLPMEEETEQKLKEPA